MFFYDYMYYSIMSVSTILVLGVGGFVGYCYTINPNNVISEMKFTAMDIGLWSINKYLTLQDSYNIYIKPYLDNMFYSTDKFRYIYIKYNCNPIFINDILDTTIINNYNLLFTKIEDNNNEDNNNEYYKQLFSIPNSTSLSTSYNIIYPFIQMELEYEGVKYELHNDISLYGIEGNIFNKTFFIYFMKTYHNKTINSIDNFNIHYMDKDVNMGTFSCNEYIKITSSGYNIYNADNNIIT